METTDATAPHLDVLLRLGGSLGMHGPLQWACFRFFLGAGVLSSKFLQDAVLCVWVAQLVHLNVFRRLGSSEGMLCVCGLLRLGCTVVCCVLNTAGRFGSVVWSPGAPFYSLWESGGCRGSPLDPICNVRVKKQKSET